MSPKRTDAGETFRSLVERASEELRGAAGVSHRPPPALQAARDGELLPDPVLDELVWSYLCWEAGEARAAPRYEAIAEHYVDCNDLRVASPSELTGVIGVTYPKAAERAERLLATLDDLFRREHAVSLDHLASLNKRKARAYLSDLADIPAYVAGRTALFGLGVHAVPLDDRLTGLLADEDALPEGLTAEEAAAWAERQLRSGEAARACRAIEFWARDRRAPGGAKPSGRSRGSRKGSTAASSPSKAAPDESGSTEA